MSAMRLFNHIAIPIFNGCIRISRKIVGRDGRADIAADAFKRDRKRALDIFREKHHAKSCYA